VRARCSPHHPAPLSFSSSPFLRWRGCGKTPGRCGAPCTRAAPAENATLDGLWDACCLFWPPAGRGLCLSRRHSASTQRLAAGAGLAGRAAGIYFSLSGFFLYAGRRRDIGGRSLLFMGGDAAAGFASHPLPHHLPTPLYLLRCFFLRLLPAAVRGLAGPLSCSHSCAKTGDSICACMAANSTARVWHLHHYSLPTATVVRGVALRRAALPSPLRWHSSGAAFACCLSPRRWFCRGLAVLRRWRACRPACPRLPACRTATTHPLPHPLLAKGRGMLRTLQASTTAYLHSRCLPSLPSWMLWFVRGRRQRHLRAWGGHYCKTRRITYPHSLMRRCAISCLFFSLLPSSCCAAYLPAPYLPSFQHAAFSPISLLF